MILFADDEKKVGRPTKSNKRDTVVRFRLTDEEVELIKEGAAFKGMNVSEFIRYMVLGEDNGSDQKL